MSIVDICWAHTAVESEFSQIWSMESGLLMWSVSCGMEFQKIFSSCCSVRVGWLTHASLSGSGSHKLITLYTENSPLAAESWRTPLIISLCLASCAFHSTPFSSCVDSHCSAFMYWAIPFNKGTPMDDRTVCLPWDENFGLTPLGQTVVYGELRKFYWNYFAREYGDILVCELSMGYSI